MKPRYSQIFEPTDSNIFLPEAMIIGTPRGGTSSLYYNLRRHPKFYPKDLLKESWALSWNWRGESSLHSFKEVHTHPQGTFNIEGSTGDLSHPKCPSRVWNINPAQKFIAMLRDPVKRAHENFWLVVKDGNETVKTFEEAVELENERLHGGMFTMFTSKSAPIENYQLYPYLERGKYVTHLKNWFRWFPPEQFLIIKSEDFFVSPQAILDQVCDFIGVEKYEFDRLDHWWDAYAIKGSKHGQWPAPELSPETALKLYDYFRPLNRELSDLLGRDFTWEYDGDLDGKND